jgi:uncharacterized 2Fe-2S/4Fe-4S cluster protein (DUF4445 family)
MALDPVARGGEPKVVFSPSGRRGACAAGTTVLDFARALGVDLDSVCGGRALCGRCQIEVAEGELAKHGIVSRAAHLTPAGETERAYAARRGLAAGRRLGCQARIVGDVAIDVPASSQLHRQLVRKPYEAHPIAVDPVVRLHYVEVEPPDLAAPSGDLERLRAALAREWGLGELAIALPALAALQGALRAAGFRVTVAVRNEREIVAIWPGFRERVHGLAIDVGSTTLAAQLCELASGETLAAGGRMNPQIRCGEDLMSRVSYAMLNPGGARELTRTVRAALGELVAELAAEAGIAAGEIVEATLVGNPVMLHLALGLDPAELGTAPFALATGSSVDASAAELELPIHPGGRVYALPAIAGHVGADAAAVLLAEALDERDDVSLVVDVGTNAELLLGNRGRLLAASSPTGPAFEGAQIRCGQRAAPGAIERVRIDRTTLEPRLRVIGCDLWSDEPGFAAALPACGVTGICGSGIVEAIAELFLAGVVRADGTIDGAAAARTPRVAGDGRTFRYLLHAGPPAIAVEQHDVRAIQLAKAALYAGASLLMSRSGVERVDRIRLAGAFGGEIDVRHAMVLGMIPDCALDRATSAGNAAGTGARIALLDRSARGRIERLVRTVEKVETAVAPEFQERFVAAMAIPHRSDPFPELARVVELPEPAAEPAGARARRRR